jgi:hypothetical protein
MRRFILKSITLIVLLQSASAGATSVTAYSAACGGDSAGGGDESTTGSRPSKHQMAFQDGKASAEHDGWVMVAIPYDGGKGTHGIDNRRGKIKSLDIHEGCTFKSQSMPGVTFFAGDRYDSHQTGDRFDISTPCSKMRGQSHVDKSHPSNKKGFDVQITDVKCPSSRNDWRAPTEVDKSTGGSSSAASNNTTPQKGASHAPLCPRVRSCSVGPSLVRYHVFSQSVL